MCENRHVPNARKIRYKYAEKNNGKALSLAEQYAEDRGLDLDNAIDEVVADMMGREKFAFEVANTQFNLAKKIRDWLRDILDRTGLHQYTEVERIYRTWEKAVEQAQKKTATEQKKGNAVANDAKVKSTGDSKGKVWYSEGRINNKKNYQYYDYSKSFSEQIDDYLNKKTPSYDTFIVGKTNDVYLDIGFNPLPITIAQGHVEAALDINSDADHYLGETKLKQLPKIIGKPVAIIRSKTHSGRVVSLLPFKNNGKTVITPFEMDGTGVMHNENINSNVITTVFGKGNILQQLLDALKSEALGKTEMFYWNKKEAIALLQAEGLQLPNSLPQDGFIHSIREKGANVNIKFKNVTQTQQFKRWFGKSKVVNKDRTPKVVYHGTREKFHIFDITKSRSWDETIDYDLPGFYFSESADESSSYGDVNGYYIKILNPYEGDIDALKKEKGSFRKAYEYLVKEGYDGVIVDELGEGFTEYIVLKPENIKSATDNIGTFDKNNLDTRYSEGSIDELLQVTKERDAALEKVEYYNGQLKRTKPFTPDAKSINRLVKRIAKGYNGDSDIARECTEAYRLINKHNSYVQENNYDKNVAAKMWEDVMDKIETLGMEIVKNTIVRNDESSQIVKDIKKQLRGTKIKFPEMYRGDFDSVGGYNTFRKKNLGRMTLHCFSEKTDKPLGVGL